MVGGLGGGVGDAEREATRRLRGELEDEQGGEVPHV